MATKIPLILLLINIVISAEMGKERSMAEIQKNYSNGQKISGIEYTLYLMEEKCKFSEKERLAKKHKMDAVSDENSAIKIAIDEAFARYYVTPKANTGGSARQVGEHKEYWYVRFHNLVQRNYVEVKEYKALISRNSGIFLCGYLINDATWYLEK